MRIYLDHNATTPPHPSVLQAMAEVIIAQGGAWGNPSSLHAEGRAAREAVESGRREIAALIGARPEEIVLTSGGTEGNNLALWASAGAVVTSPLEHPSVQEVAKRRRRDGADLIFLPVDRRGRLDPEDLRRALRGLPRGVLVSLALVNHELGNVYPVAELARICHEYGALLHCDAVQAVGRLLVDVQVLDVDLLTLSAHKLHGPKGAGALYCRAGRGEAGGPLPLLWGGQQERGRRAGTENVPGIVGFGVACKTAREGLPGRASRIAALRDSLEARLRAIPGAVVHGDVSPGGRAPGTCNVGFAGVEGELLMMNLDLLGVAVSTGAACKPGSLTASPVLQALGCSREQALEAVRLSLGSGNTQEEVDQVAAWVEEIVGRIRGLGNTL